MNSTGVGLIRGAMILKRMMRSLAPSIRADSERLSGTASMAVRIGSFKNGATL